MGALWLITVYCATGLLVLWLANRFLVPISKPLGAALLLLPLLMTGRAVLTGGFYGPLNISYASAPLSARAGDLGVRDYRDFGNAGLSDVAIQMLPWRKAVRDAVFSGRPPLLNRSMLSGDILVAASQPAAFHPNVWLGFLLPLPLAWTFACTLTFLLAALTAFLFFREIGLREGPAFFGAAVWTLSNALAIMVGWPLAHVFSVLPLLLFGLRRIAREVPGGFGSIVVALALMVTGGHGETLLHVIAGAGVWFLFELWAARRPFRAVGLSAAAGMLALGISAVALLPFIEALPQTLEKVSREALFATARKSQPLRLSVANTFALVYPKAFEGVPPELLPAPPSYGGLTYGFVGVLPLALAAVGVASRRREKWGLIACGLLALLVSSGFPGVTDLVTSLPLFDIAINEYFVFVTTFSVAALAAIGLDSIARGEGPRRAGVLLTAVLCLVLLGAFEWRGRLIAQGIRPVVQDEGILFALLATLPVAVLFATHRPPARWLVPCVVALFLLVRTLEVPRLYPTFPRRLFYPPVEEIESLPRRGEPYRVVGQGYSFVPNQQALYGLEDPRGYEAMTLKRYYETYPLWSVHQPVWFNRVDDLTTPFLAFLNVRFAIAERTAKAPAGWKEFARGEHCAIFENPSALPRAFAPARIRLLSDSRSAVEEMKACQDFAGLGWIEMSGAARSEIENGPAVVRTREEGNGYVLEVEAAKPSWVITSMSAWKGWKGYLGERRLPLAFANHAFLGFLVPAGSHRVRLIYWPDSFTWGLAISGVSILGITVYSLRRRARRVA